VAGSVSVGAVCLASQTLSLAKLALSATSFTIRVGVRVVFRSRKTKFALHLFHAAAIVLVSVGSWCRRGCLRLSFMRTVDIAIHGVVMSRLRARRFVGDSGRNGSNRLSRSVSRSIASFLPFA
jgi:hypothetical protein